MKLRKVLAVTLVAAMTLSLIHIQMCIRDRCMDAGADLVVGAHTHCLEGIEYIDGKPVFYSLGNFIFGQNIDRSAAVKVTVIEDGTVSYALIPVYASDGQTKQMDANAAPWLFSYMESISDNASVDAAGNISEKQYRRNSMKNKILGLPKAAVIVIGIVITAQMCIRDSLYFILADWNKIAFFCCDRTEG